MIDEVMNSNVAGDVLHELMPDKPADEWAIWLRNNRNQSRQVSYRVPFERISNGAFYRKEDLAEFAAWEKSRQLGTLKLSPRAKEALEAFGVGIATGSTTGRKLTVTGINPQVDEATGKTFIQMIFSDPLRVYRVELGQAEAVAKELNEAIQFCKRAK